MQYCALVTQVYMAIKKKIWYEMTSCPGRDNELHELCIVLRWRRYIVLMFELEQFVSTVSLNDKNIE